MSIVDKEIYSIREYNSDFFNEWNSLVEKSSASTFQHSRSFLDYHGKRFVERSLVIFEGEKLVAVFPAASIKGRDNEIISHAGAAYSGLVFDDSLYGEEIITIYRKIIHHYKEIGMERLIIKLVPEIYRRVTVQDELYALWRLGFELSRVDLSATINLSNRLKVSSQRKRSLKKAKAADLVIDQSFDNIDRFYCILEENLKGKHSAIPTHTINELHDLNKRLPNTIRLSCVKNSEGIVIAGVLIFVVNNVCHCQYIASSDYGYEVNALDFLFENEISSAVGSGFSYFSFGISNEQEGKVLNQSLYRFKRQFGAGSIAHQFFKVDL